MDRGRKGNFPTRSSGVGGKRGFGIRSSFLFPHDEEPSQSDTAEENIENENRNVDQNRPSTNDEENVLDWIESIDGAPVNGREPLESISDTSEPESNNESQSYNHSQEDIDDESSGHSEERIPLMGYTNFSGFPPMHGGFSLTGHIGPPVLGQGGLALRLNGCNALEYRPGICPGFQAGHSSSNFGIQEADQGQGQAAEFGGMYGMGRDENYNAHRINNGSLFDYTTTTAHALLRRNGDILSDMLSLRDSHVFKLPIATNYANAITQICNNQELSDALITHVDCVKALMSRNIPMALIKQTACVNAVMKLINNPYTRQEEWTFAVIRTVSFDLRIIGDRAASMTCRGTPIIHYDWNICNVVCFFHPNNCQCHRSTGCRSQGFHRRF